MAMKMDSSRRLLFDFRQEALKFIEDYENNEGSFHLEVLGEPSISRRASKSKTYNRLEVLENDISDHSKNGYHKQRGGKRKSAIPKSEYKPVDEDLKDLAEELKGFKPMKMDFVKKKTFKEDKSSVSRRESMSQYSTVT